MKALGCLTLNATAGNWLEKHPFFFLSSEKEILISFTVLRSNCSSLLKIYLLFLSWRVLFFPSTLQATGLLPSSQGGDFNGKTVVVRTGLWLVKWLISVRSDNMRLNKNTKNTYEARLFRIRKRNTHYLITTRAERFSISFLEDVCKFLQQFLFNTGKILKATLPLTCSLRSKTSKWLIWQLP